MNDNLPMQTQQFSIEAVMRQMELIDEVVTKVMKKDVHYGIIPGTDKPTILLPGAQKLAVLFRLRTNFEVKITDLGDGHREYSVTCNVVSVAAELLGQGVGSCSTMEKKFRWRRSTPQATDKSVPKEYWDAKKSGQMAVAQELLGGKEFTTIKTDNGWMIATKGKDQVENKDIADQYNTCLKMAKKRAYNDAILTVTGTSDKFTQDMEEQEDDDDAQPIAPKAKPSRPQSTGDMISYTLDPKDRDFAKKKTALKDAGFKWNKDLTRWEGNKPIPEIDGDVAETSEVSMGEGNWDYEAHQ